ncbi:hypothetical protein [Clostridium tetani]|uniref:hypothetical protein n=1 Tax=Clostridium tetani TaxID=1513 RepID=UPI001F618E63|nr:hypothetical protein [Clostridium tetani]
MNNSRSTTIKLNITKRLVVLVYYKRSFFIHLYNLHYARLRDLVKLMELRCGMCRMEDGSLKPTGSREFMCFLYRYWSSCYEGDTENALNSTLDFNKQFKEPEK